MDVKGLCYNGIILDIQTTAKFVFVTYGPDHQFHIYTDSIAVTWWLH